ncbi:FAD-binding oxidoreductase [Variovorax sp. UMC13]|uniref:NAD(P)/FAD-dependent oxidoreductase n=1 Tax=Variovorax sp. UMC13 TaxID=1862326 RepID=UPI001603955F|nr:FAD-binding oxidoreductase [Variovorax sp. UMC13]MBB1598476.1 hypothetical protein [Variovorax sp. UMC13]
MSASLSGATARSGPGIAVIGGGIVGLACALSLQRALGDVTLYDLLPPGGGASYGNSGLVAVDSCGPLAMPGMMRRIPGWLMDPDGPLAVDPRYAFKALPWLLARVRSGSMERIVATSDGLRLLHKGALDAYRELLGPAHFADLIRCSEQLEIWESEESAAARAIVQRLRERHGIAVRVLDRAEVADLVPGISPVITHGALLSNGGFVVNPLRLLTVLTELFRQAGGRVRHERVMKLVPPSDAQGWRLISSHDDTHHGRVVVAGGAASRELLAPLGIHLPLEAERGYHVMLRDPGFHLPLPLLYKSRGFGVVPMEDGLRVAGTVEIAAPGRPMNERRAQSLLNLVQQLLPGVRGEERSVWMGSRPSFPDNLPVIERARIADGLFIACGHGHFGMTSGPITGRLMTQLVAGAPTSVDLAPFRSQRFARA